MLAIGFPVLPAERSQLLDAVKMFQESDHIMPPDTLGRRLYLFAFLEGSPEQPYGLHLQVQSQTFYRMMIGRYYDMKLHRIFEGASQGLHVAPQPVTVTVKVIPGKPVMQAFNMQEAYDTYDRLTEEFWQSYALSFEEAAAKRMRDGQGEPVGNNGEFYSSFSDLPNDKKRVFDYLDPKKAESRYQSHRELLFNTAFRPLTHSDSQVAYQNAPFDRKVASAGTSTSGRKL